MHVRVPGMEPKVLIDMLLFRTAMVRPSRSQSSLFEARPRDFVRLQVPANGEPTADKAQGAGVGRPGRRDEPAPRD